MVTTTPARAAAELIFESYRKVQPFERLPADLFPKTLDEAYAIQLELHCMLSSLWGPLAGYKLAYTTPVMQERAGLNHPVLGGLFEKVILRSPVVLNFTEYVNLGIELEVGVTLGKDLPASGAPYTRDSVAEAVSEVATAFEIVDMRTPADLTTEERTLMSVAVNILNSGVVLGDPVTNWRDLDLVGCKGVMSINHEQVGEGYGRDVMGHPFEPLVWLANELAKHNHPLKAGDVVITGSLVPPTPLEFASEGRISIEGLGEAVVVVA
jgi:2-oxo-3-hexenedioate decarboxylase/2-keto-4-pentenoate hydratase